MILGPRFGDYHAGYRFAQLSVDLVDKLGAERFKTRVYCIFGELASPWLRHIRESDPFFRRACETALKSGDLIFGSFAWRARAKTRLACGDPLAEVQQEAETGLAFARKAQFGLAIELISSLLRLIRLLRGQTPSFASFNDHEFDETDYERQLEGQPELLHALHRYCDYKLFARFYAEDYASALVAAAKAESMSEHKIPSIDYAEYHFYAALANAAIFASSSVDEKTRHFDALVVHHRQLSLWAEDCPANFLTEWRSWAPRLRAWKAENWTRNAITKRQFDPLGTTASSRTKAWRTSWLHVFTQIEDLRPLVMRICKMRGPAIFVGVQMARFVSWT